MKKKATLLLALMALGFGSGLKAQGDYYVAHGADVNINHGTHYPKSVSIVGTQSEDRS